MKIKDIKPGDKLTLLPGFKGDDNYTGGNSRDDKMYGGYGYTKGGDIVTVKSVDIHDSIIWLKNHEKEGGIYSRCIKELNTQNLYKII